MARYSAAKIIVRYHIGEPNEVTSDLAAFAYFNDIFSLGSQYLRRTERRFPTLRGFSTCCLRFKNGVAATPARLASGWLAGLCREGVEPSGSR
jgi:hypothetical protein